MAWARAVFSESHNPFCYVTIAMSVTVLPGYPDWVGSLVLKYPQSTSSDGAVLAVGPWSQTESPTFHHWTKRRTCQQ